MQHIENGSITATRWSTQRRLLTNKGDYCSGALLPQALPCWPKGWGDPCYCSIPPMRTLMVVSFMSFGFNSNAASSEKLHLINPTRVHASRHFTVLLNFIFLTMLPKNKTVIMSSQEGISGHTKPCRQSRRSSRFIKVKKKNALPKYWPWAGKEKRQLLLRTKKQEFIRMTVRNIQGWCHSCSQSGSSLSPSH